jgi:hypothetical protein
MTKRIASASTGSLRTTTPVVLIRLPMSAGTLLLADLFAVEPQRVAKDTQRERKKLHEQNKVYCEVRD